MRTNKQKLNRINKITQLLEKNRESIENLRRDERTQRKFNLWAKRTDLVNEKEKIEEQIGEQIK